MLELGYSLSSEEHGPNELIRFAQRAEKAGFSFALISDHYHPWTRQQGQSPFAWSVLGAIAATTKNLRVGTGVTCPFLRIHPGIVAQAAATAAAMMPDRFFLGLGTGENLNEHIVGRKWPSASERHEMLREAVEIIRLLWQGGTRSYYGRHFMVENAELYTLPSEAPHIYIAAGGDKSAELAAKVGDGLITVGANEDVIKKFHSEGGTGKPKYAQLTVCWAKTEKEARQIAHETWPISAMPASLLSELALPQYFENAAGILTEDAIAQRILCGPDPKRHLDLIQKAADAGSDHIYIHQVGKDQEGFFRFYESEILPEFGLSTSRVA